jgi:hypothetical protein
VLSCAATPVFAGSTVTVPVKEGSVKFKEFLAAAPVIANSKTSKLVNPETGGKVISIGDKKYEIRFFSFEDTSGKLPTNITFKEYIEKLNLLDATSTQTEPLPGIIFESFDFRKFKLNDGVYFSMAIREL